MRSKIIFLFVLITSFVCNNTMAQTPTTVLPLANHISYNEKGEPVFEPMSYPFFDFDINKIYFSYSLPKFLIQHDTISYLLVEIKKKTVAQQKLKPLLSKTISLQNLSSSDNIDSIDITEGLATGNFDIEINFFSDSHEKICIAKNKFQIIRKDSKPLKLQKEDIVLDNNIAIEKTFVAKYDREQLIKNCKALLPICDFAEARVLKNVDEEKEEKTIQQFFYNFWQKRNALNPEKEWKDYTNQLNFVAKKYGTGTLKGYETDRGKVYLLFGEPHTTETRLNEKGSLPYEVWYYYETKGRKNVSFLFYQPASLGGQMNILNSSEQDILINPYWKQTLLENPNDADNKLKYRVFEYFK